MCNSGEVQVHFARIVFEWRGKFGNFAVLVEGL